MSAPAGSFALSITASAGRAQCALHDPSGQLAGSNPEPGDILPTIQRVCAEHGIEPSSIHRLRIDIGPGSYTGLRTSITFARSLAALRAHQPELPPLQVATTTSFELITADLVDSPTDLHILLDARRGRVHHGHLIVDAQRIRLQQPPQAIPLPAVAAALGTNSSIWVSPSCRDAVQAQLGTANLRHTARPLRSAGGNERPARPLRDHRAGNAGTAVPDGLLRRRSRLTR